MAVVMIDNEDRIKNRHGRKADAVYCILFSTQSYTYTGGGNRWSKGKLNAGVLYTGWKISMIRFMDNTIILAENERNLQDHFSYIE